MLASKSSNLFKNTVFRTVQRQAGKSLTSASKAAQIPVTNKNTQPVYVMGCKPQVRAFSSYPDHMKLEMPNLSPTMEKVSS